MGFRGGHAKLIAPHLGGLRPAPAPPEAPANITVTATMDPAADARSQAASDATVEALRRLTRRDTHVNKLNDGTLERPTVAQVMKWAEDHADTAAGNHTGVTTAVEKITKQSAVNLAGLDNTDEDKEYYKVVKRSLTAEQYAAYGGGENSSAMLLIQRVVTAVVNKPFAVLQRDVSKLTMMGETWTKAAVPSRINQFEQSLLAVRHHPILSCRQQWTHCWRLYHHSHP